jgi:hypothetical protein
LNERGWAEEQDGRFIFAVETIEFHTYLTGGRWVTPYFEDGSRSRFVESPQDGDASPWA